MARGGGQRSLLRSASLPRCVFPITCLGSKRSATILVMAISALQVLNLLFFCVSICLSLAAGKACMVMLPPLKPYGYLDLLNVD